MTNVVKLDTLTTAMALAEKYNVSGNLCSAHLMVYGMPKIEKMHVHARNAGLAIYSDTNFCDVLPTDTISEYVVRTGESPASKKYRGAFYAYLNADQIEKTLTALFQEPEAKEEPKPETTEEPKPEKQEEPAPEAKEEKKEESSTESAPKKNRRNSKNKSNKK